MDSVSSIRVRYDEMIKRRDLLDNLVGNILLAGAANAATASSSPDDVSDTNILGGALGQLTTGLPSILPTLLPLPDASSLISLNAPAASAVPTLTLQSSTPSGPLSSSVNPLSSQSVNAETPATSAPAPAPSSDTALSASSTPTPSVPTGTASSLATAAADSVTTDAASLTDNSSTLLPPSLSSSALSSASKSATASASSASGSSFLQNKPLSISVITISSIVGLVFVVILATWAIRRRRHNKLEDLVSDLSTDQLVGPVDVEKGNGGAGFGGGMSPGGNTMLETRPRQGSKDSISGGAPSSFGRGSAPTPSVGIARGREMYEQTGFPALPVFVATQPRSGEVKSQNPQSYNFAGIGAAAQGFGHPPRGIGSHPQLPNPFDDPQVPVALSLPSAAYLPAQPAIVRKPSYEISTRIAQRKPPPPLLRLDIASAPSVVSAGPHSAVSLHATPMQLPSSVNPANPIVPAIQVASPQSGGPTNGSPHTSTTPQSAGSPWDKKASYSRALDPTIPDIPVPLPLPEAVALPKRDIKGKKPMRQLKVVNE